MADGRERPAKRGQGWQRGNSATRTAYVDGRWQSQQERTADGVRSARIVASDGPSRVVAITLVRPFSGSLPREAGEG